MLEKCEIEKHEDGIEIVQYYGKDKIIIIPKEVKYLRYGAFDISNPYVEEIYIHKDVKEIGCSCFKGLINLKKIVIDPLNPYYSTKGCNVVFENKTRRVIAGTSYSKIPNDTREIYPEAFFQAIYLKEIKLPEPLEIIGNHAFYNCHSLKELYIPKNVKDLSTMNPFDACWGLEKIIVDPLNKIYSSFENSNCLIDKRDMSLISGCKNSIIPEGVRILDYACFEDIGEIEYIKLPSTIKKIEIDAFSNCVSLRKIEIPNSVLFLNSHSFSNCINLEEVKLSDNISYIPRETFSGCTKLKKIIYLNKTYDLSSLFEEQIDLMTLDK